MPERVLYLHGFASGPNSKKALFLRDRLRARGCEVEVPDLAGGDFERLTVTGQLQAVERAARGEAVSLIGSSLGGYVAALYAARHPEVRRVVLLAPAFGFARLIEDGLPPGQAEQWRRTGWLPTFHYGEGRPSRIWYGLVEDGLGYEPYPVVRQPALIFHGTRDEDVPCRVSEEFARGNPGATLRLVDSDHELYSALEEIGEGAEGFLTAG